MINDLLSWLFREENDAQKQIIADGDQAGFPRVIFKALLW